MSEPLEIDAGLVIPAGDLSVEFSRSSGPGGQHVNTADTRVRLRFALDACAVLDEPVKERLRALRPGQLTGTGELIMTCETHRSRHRNLQEVRARLARLIALALQEPAARRPTRPSRASRRRRLARKRRRAAIKQSRRKVSDGDDG